MKYHTAYERFMLTSLCLHDTMYYIKHGGGMMPNKKDRSNMSTSDRIKWAQSIKTVSTQVRVHMRELAGATMYLDLHKRNPMKKAEVVALCFHQFIWEKVHAGKIVLPETTEDAFRFVKSKLDLNLSGDDMEALAYQMMAEDEGLVPISNTKPTVVPIEEDVMFDEFIPRPAEYISTTDRLQLADTEFNKGNLTREQLERIHINILDDAPVEELTPTQTLERQARIDARQKQQMKDAMQEKKDT